MIQHVTHEIDPGKLDACVDFYGLLGFRATDAPPGIAGRAVWLEHRGTAIHLMIRAGATAEAGHVGVVVEAYAETVAKLARAGFEVQPRREHWGAPRSYVSDPAGNRVELMAWAPGDGAGR